MIDFNGMSIRLGLFFAYRFGNRVNIYILLLRKNFLYVHSPLEYE